MAGISLLVCRTMDASGVLPIKQQRTLSPKGKEKMGEEVIGDGTVCGICFSGGGLAVRGRIDSCDHYFCFICIMEWARVESRCPMCKQRFHFISRPNVSGLSMSESALKIPVRDQVYHPLGNESRALSDPYAQVNCRVCDGSNDDELLLLCDLCDSAFHTYCTGLGYTVPEGDWYCHDCTILREEHAKIDDNAGDRDQDQGTLVLDQQQPVSIFDIVADERSSTIEQQHFHDRAASRSSTNLQRNSEGILLHVEEELDSSYSSQGNPYVQRRVFGRRDRASQHSCMQSRVQALRKNWTFLQSESLAFSSNLDGNGEDTVSGAKSRTSTPNSDLTQQNSNSSASANSELRTDSSSSRKLPAISDLQDITKAWKMMRLAKKQRFPMANTPFSSLPFNNSSNSLTAVSISEAAASHSVKLPKNRMAADKLGCKLAGFYQKISNTDSSIPSPRQGNRLAVKASSDMQSGSFETKRTLTTELAGNVKEVSETRLSSTFHEPTSSSLSAAACEGARKSFRVCCNIELSQDGNAAATVHTSSNSSSGNEVSDNKTKSVIQSMVKRNLSRLSKGECLGSGKFKEIARASTHSILAACGLEHSESCARPFSIEICRHANQMLQQLHGSSSPMAGSCTICFHSFVKHVVESILLERRTTGSR